MSEENKALYRQMIDTVWSKGDLDAIDDFFAADVIIHSAPPEWPAGSAGVRATVSTWRGALSGFRMSAPFVLGDGDQVANYWTITGTHSGELLGVPATGKRIEVSGMSLVRIENGKIAEIWGASDQLALMRALGAFPS